MDELKKFILEKKDDNEVFRRKVENEYEKGIAYYHGVHDILIFIDLEIDKIKRGRDDVNKNN